MTTGAHRTANATVGAHGAVAITPNDTTVIPVTRAIYVGVAGDIKVTMADGQAVTFSNVPVGVLPIQVQVVWTTGTSATTMLALY
jgi:hypothetical protein